MRAVMIMIAVSLLGCASHTPKPDTTAAALDLAGEPGLEVRWWVVDDRDRAVGRSLRDLEAGPTPLDAAMRERLRRAGLRVIEVDADDLAALPAGWRTLGAVQEHHFRMTPDWSEIVLGPRLPGGSRADTGEEAVELGAGAFRLAARCWSEPGKSLADAPRTRIELVPEYVPTARASVLSPAGPTRFAALRAAWSCAEPTAVLLVGEDPSVDWSSQPEPPEPEAPEPAVEDEEESGEAPPFWPDLTAGGEVPGPTPARVPTIGEAMLATRPSEGRPGGLRIVVAVIVRPPETWSLLGR